MKKLILPALVVLMSLSAIADKGGSEGVGGGDATEGRVNEIRLDLLQWLETDGPGSLTMPAGLSEDTYIARMKKYLAAKYVVVGFISTKQEAKAKSAELKVEVDGQPKTCVSSVWKSDNRPHIQCNIERFRAITESEQYRLIHHEYAGLAGVEKNIGAASDYELSNQITDFLAPETVLRLGVKKMAQSNASIDDEGFEELSESEYLRIGQSVFVGFEEAQFSNCRINAVSSNIELSDSQVKLSIPLTYGKGYGTEYFRSTLGQPIVRVRFDVGDRRTDLLIYTDATETKIVRADMNRKERYSKNVGTLTKPVFETAYREIYSMKCQ